jgi:hypothetical protein
MTADEFRNLALSLPEAVERAHMGHPDFRVRGKIFATIWPDDEWGMVKLTPAEQDVFVQAEPKVFEPVNGAWGARGCTKVRLRSAKKTIVWRALVDAWRNTAPKRLAQQFEDE